MIGRPPRSTLFPYTPLSRSSDTYRVNLSPPSATLDLQMQEFKPGSPGLFVGHVVGPNGAAVPGATVWRLGGAGRTVSDRKSTRLNSSHLVISYAVFCLKKKN